jgi:RNA polymerase sigma-54 factor
MPQVVARASLLELNQDDLEDAIRERLDENPALELVESAVWRRDTTPRGGHEGSSEDAIARLPAAMSFKDDLRWQARTAAWGEELRAVEYLIDSLDQRGYLPTCVFEVANELDTSEEEVEAALRVLQELDPPGVGARSLAECLTLQVQARKVSEVPAGLLEFLQDEFPCLVQQADARALRTGPTPRAHAFLAYVRDNLYPYPADLFHPPYPALNQGPPAAPPDAIVACNEGRLQVSVPMSERLALRVDAAYEDLARTISARQRDGDAGEVRRLVAEAKGLIANLAHRHTVIGRVAAAVVRAQEAFVTHGPSALKPLTKKELAQQTGLHESTVCRATRGKSIMLPGGEVVPFDVFFEDALPAKVTLAQVIHHENAARPFSDLDLVAEMERRGYPIARRTVTKYRTALEIAPASERRAAAEARLQGSLRL